MTKTFAALAAAATLATASLATPTTAEARCWGCAVGAGIIGGIAAGALIGSAAAAYPYYGGYYGYSPYYAPAPAYYGGPGCSWQRQRFWDGYAWRVRRMQVCG